MKIFLFSGLLLLVGVIQAGEEVSYKSGELTLNGYIARPAEGTGPRGAVLVVHEWWGHNAYVRRRADMLADLGYVALAVDMYGDGKLADHPKDAKSFMMEVKSNMDEGETRFRAAMTLLQSQADVDGHRIAAIGYCFGGSIVLEMSRRGLPLAAVASFHGSLSGLSPVPVSGIKGKVLVANGADDPFIKPEQIAQFKQEMDAAGVDYQFVNYAGAKHSFTNPGATAVGEKFEMPLEYHAEADRESWVAMQAMLADVLR